MEIFVETYLDEASGCELMGDLPPETQDLAKRVLWQPAGAESRLGYWLLDRTSNDKYVYLYDEWGD